MDGRPFQIEDPFVHFRKVRRHQDKGCTSGFVLHRDLPVGTQQITFNGGHMSHGVDHLQQTQMHLRRHDGIPNPNNKSWLIFSYDPQSRLRARCRCGWMYGRSLEINFMSGGVRYVAPSHSPQNPGFCQSLMLISSRVPSFNI